MATIKVKHAPKTDDAVRLYVEIEVSDKELAAHGPVPVLEALGREVGNALVRERKG
jgi:hypothetical protein